MKKPVFVTIFLAIFYAAHSQNLSAYFSYCTFDIPGNSPYIETYINITGPSVKLIPAENDLLKGQVEVQWIIRSGEKIVHADKYNLISPGIHKNDSIVPDFLDQQRINFEKGEYTIELTIRDKNTETKAITLNEKFKIGFLTDSISISDIELIESYTKSPSPGKFTKNGYDILPYIHAFYPKDIGSLKFYAEIYRSDVTPGDDYLVRYYISGMGKNKPIENYVSGIKHSPKSINPIIGEFNISELPSGNYSLYIEARNRKNEVIALNRADFQRSNERNKPLVTADINAIDVKNTFISSQINKDSLIDYIACLYPISSKLEVEIAENQMAISDVKSMQQYIYYFWSNRNKEDPEKAWLDYKQEVIKVNNAYASRIEKGYDTDRGRVYLQYGPPNIINESKDNPAAYPYEIWQYYKLKNQSNRKFVFYTTELSANDYKLLHSDAIGEPYLSNWELKLYDRTQQFGIDLGEEKSIDTYGGHSKEDFSNPK